MPSSKISNEILENLHEKDAFYMKKYEITKQSSHTSLNSELTLILNSLNNKGSIYYKIASLIQKELGKEHIAFKEPCITKCVHLQYNVFTLINYKTKKKPLNEITNYFNRSYYETHLEDQEAKRPKVKHNSIELEDQNAKHPKVKHNSIENGDRFDQKLTEFWNSLKSTRIKENFLNLTKNIRRLRITGNPSIEKTFFGYYLLYLLAQEDKIVVFDSFYIVDKFNLITHCNNLNIWYISDANKPKEINAKTIVVCSSRKDCYKNFDRYYGATIRYMPVWTLYKITEWIPRFVLEKANDQTQQDKLENAIVRCDEKIFYYIGENKSRDDISHKLIYISMNPPEENNIDYKNSYTKKALKFASKYVGYHMTLRLENAIWERLKNEMRLSLLDGKSNQFIGNFFEQIAHYILRRGGEFEIRSLDSNESNTLKLNQQNEVLVFSSVNTISNAKYFQPSSKNFPSIDAIITPDKLFQITTAWEHPIKAIGITKLRSKLSKKGYISLFFVVPANLYNDYKKQRFNSEQEIENHIKQYALKIDLSSKRHR
ncbi:17999_t:CDS:2 [Gigaspora margarita]|uniref:17999_t:CDS:1 n=1 Tax=Gigaspora margarita TaxID=4874 RepID=A0ABN7V3L8_GIGMA|nr:17999_t:CDS:2 [Gigaspora margarita]